MNQRPIIVAEIGANHLGSVDRALLLVSAAAQAGADAVKFQCWSPGTMCVDSQYRLTGTPWKGEKLADLYELCFTPWEWMPKLFAEARRQGMLPFASCFDAAAVDFVDALNPVFHKVASYELVDLPLIRHMASKHRPMILSCGMGDFEEIEAAIDATDGLGQQLTLLQCTSAYPANCSESNLLAMPEIADIAPITRDVVYGLSDHTPGIGAAVAAVALGATMIEKHLTLSRADGGPDASFSMEPDEFRQLVTECKRAHAALGHPGLGPKRSEDVSLRRSLYWIKDKRYGELIEANDIATARPALGDHPDRIGHYLGKIVTGGPIQRGTPVRPEHVG